MRDIKLSLLRKMLRIREFEEKVAAVYPEQQMRCPVHLSIGQEATAAGVCEALTPDDLVFAGHRSHGPYIAKGGSLRALAAELYGKATGCCDGVGGSMHLIDLSVNYVASIPIVGGIIPIAVGAALASDLTGSPAVTTVFFGDAAVETGAFHESMNFALVRNLPVLFFCENNLYSVYSSLESRQPNRPISDLARGHGMKTFAADGNDAVQMYQVAKEAREYVRGGSRPAFLIADTYRWREHCGPNFDNDIGYRTDEEFLRWKAKCPIASLRAELSADGVPGSELEDLLAQVRAEVEDAFVFAKGSEFPERGKLFEHVYSAN